MTLNIQHATDLKPTNTTYMIYADPGSGKTSTVRYLPGKTLVVDMDRTTRVLKGLPDVDVVEADIYEPFKTLPALLAEVKSVSENYDNIVLDNISQTETLMLQQLGREGKNNGVPSMPNYQQVQFKIKEAIAYLKTFNKRVVITAWEQTDKWTEPGGRQFNRSYPKLSTKILPDVMGLCDVVGRLTLNEKSQERGFVLMPTPNIFAKNQLDARAGCKQGELFNEDEKL